MGTQPGAADPATGWTRAALELAVLSVINEGPQHGYALAQRLAAAGLSNVTGGMLYPVLGRLEASGAVASTWHAGDGGPGRKVYEITATGRHRLAADRARWRAFTMVVDNLLTTTEA